MINDWSARAIDPISALQGGTSLSGGSTVDGTLVSNDGKDGTLVEVVIAVGGSALTTGPAEVYICQEVGAGGSYEDHNTATAAYTVPGQAASTTYRRAFFVPGSVPAFRVRIRNPNSGQSFTPTVYYKQAATT